LARPRTNAKLCISARSEWTNYACVGDIDFTLAREKHGGATVAFGCEALWNSISQCLVGVSMHLKPGPKTAAEADRVEEP